MNKQTLLALVVLVVVLGAGYWFISKGGSQSPSASQAPTELTLPENKPSESSATPELKNESGAASATGATQTIQISGKPFAYTPAEVKVKKGTTLKIVFTNESGFHDWTLEGYDVKTPQIAAGKSAEVTFTADKIGTFAYYCSVDGHRGNGMEGKLIVE